jgi:hypothetical protein
MAPIDNAEIATPSWSDEKAGNRYISDAQADASGAKEDDFRQVSSIASLPPPSRLRRLSCLLNVPFRHSLARDILRFSS